MPTLKFKTSLTLLQISGKITCEKGSRFKMAGKAPNVSPKFFI